MTNKEKGTFGELAKFWAAKEGLHGTQAFFRFVIFTYLDCLSKESDEFIFKGGNLLWLYTHTPRQTIDLDLVTRTVNKTDQVKAILERSCRHAEGVQFKVISIKEVAAQEMKGAAATIGYSTEDGASNKFDIDIVYTLPTRTTVLPSPLTGRHELHVATLENIIADKISTCHRFGAGNTRMKDYDNLWRLASENRPVEWKTVSSLLALLSSPDTLRPEWINDEMSAAWRRHIRRCKDLPPELASVLRDINQWLGGILHG